MSTADHVLAPDVDARAIWDSLSSRDAAGERYLEERGLWPECLVAGDRVRFGRTGAIAVPLRHLAIGDAIVNVVRRRLPDQVAAGGPKVAGLGGRWERPGVRGPGAPTSGTLVGSVDDIAPGGDAIVVEGVADSLAAALAWPFAAICGAHGAGRLAEVAGEVAARCRAIGARLLLVAQDDVTGVKAGVAAARAAIAAGLVAGGDLIAVDLGGARDLAAAWKDGWRPC